MAYSVTPYETGGTAGTQVGEGKVLQFAESALVQPTRTGELVVKGDPVVAGKITGVALLSAAASTDQIPVATKGIFNLSVLRADLTGNVAVALGDALYIAPATAVVSKINTGMLFGYALAAAAVGDGSATVLPVLLAESGEKPGAQFSVSMQFAAADVAKTVFVAPVGCRLLKANARWGTKAGQAGTLTLEKCNTGEAAAAGDVMLAAAFDLTGNNDVPLEKLAVADGKEVMVAGDAIRFKLASGAATSLADACITLWLELV
jgi:predicted RecA/RadA family phage recombinase